MRPFFHLLFILLLVSGLSCYGQQRLSLEIKNSTLMAADSLMPFWFVANRDGKVQEAGQVLNLTDLFVGQPYQSLGAGVGYYWGVNGVAGIGGSRYLQLNRAFAGVAFQGWALTGGMFYDPVRYEGLSSANGNLARSRNARPHPRLRLSTRSYLPVPLAGQWLSFRAAYEEGLLNDERFVDNARLHHKSLYLRVTLPQGWELEGGVEHYAMWGGTSRNETIGALPSGGKSYLHYVLGKSGSESFPLTDRLNVAGNQLGTYQFRATKSFAGADAIFFLSHPFEDLSGMNWRNWPDNLLGLHLSFSNKNRLVTDVLYEFTNTRQQSIRGAWDRQEPDSYYNNGVYRSGFTYREQMMGSPLFFPVNVSGGIAQGIGSNLLMAHHLGMKGKFGGSLQWKGLLTRIQHEGRYFSRYQPAEVQLSGLLEVACSFPDLPLGLGLSAAADASNTAGRNMGVWISIRYGNK